MFRDWIGWRKLSLVAALFACLAAAYGCGGSQGGSQAGGNSEGDTRVAVVTPYMANATTKLAIDLFEEKAEAKGWQVNVTDTAGDFNKLNGAIEDAVTQKVDAVVLGMGDPTQMKNGLATAQEASVPVFGIDAGVAPGVAANVTSDNAFLGRTSAEDLVKRIGEKGSVVMFTHDPQPSVNERAKAATAVFAEHPDIEVIEKKHVEVPGPVDSARSSMQDLLTSYPDEGSVGGVWAAWDEPAMGATQAIDAAGRSGEIAVVGVDGTDFAKAQIKQGGPFKSTVEQDWNGITAKTVELVEGQLNGQAPDKDVYTLPGELITAEGA